MLLGLILPRRERRPRVPEPQLRRGPRQEACGGTRAQDFVRNWVPLSSSILQQLLAIQGSPFFLKPMLAAGGGIASVYSGALLVVPLHAFLPLQVEDEKKRGRSRVAARRRLPA